MKTISLSKIKSGYLTVARKIGASLACPTRAQMQITLFTVGVGLLTLGFADLAHALGGGGGNGGAVQAAQVSSVRLNAVMSLLFGYIEGSFGALIMVAAGIGAIVSAAFGQYRAALGMLVVAVGSFMLRSLVATFFPDANIVDN